MHVGISLWLYCVRNEASRGGIAKEIQEFWNLMKKILSMDVSRVDSIQCITFKWKKTHKKTNVIQVFYITKNVSLVSLYIIYFFYTLVKFTHEVIKLILWLVKLILCFLEINIQIINEISLSMKSILRIIKIYLFWFLLFIHLSTEYLLNRFHRTGAF